MSRKHFILLAAALRAHRLKMACEHCDMVNSLDELIYSIALVCRQCNKEFSFDTFYAASNYKGRDNGYT